MNYTTFTLWDFNYCRVIRELALFTVYLIKIQKWTASSSFFLTLLRDWLATTCFHLDRDPLDICEPRSIYPGSWQAELHLP